MKAIWELRHSANLEREAITKLSNSKFRGAIAVKKMYYLYLPCSLDRFGSQYSLGDRNPRYDSAFKEKINPAL